MKTPLRTLGVYAPLPGSRSGLADYAVTSNAALADTYEYTCVSLQNYTAPTQFDDVLYHVGCGRDSVAAYRALRQRPGPVILHEHILSQFFVENHDRLDAETNAAVSQAFSAHLGHDHNSSELHAVMERQRHLHYADLGLERLVVQRATTVFSHSVSAVAELRRRYGMKIQALEFPVMPLPQPDATVRTELAIEPDAVVFGSFGFVGSHKRLPTLIEAWSHLNVDPNQGCLLAVGQGTQRYQSHAGPSLVLHDYVASTEAFRRLLATVNVGVQLRGPTLGETSGVVAQLLVSDIPVIVSSRSVLPIWANESIVRVVPIQDQEEDSLADAIATWLRQRPHGPGRATEPHIPAWRDSILPALAGQS